MSSAIRTVVETGFSKFRSFAKLRAFVHSHRAVHGNYYYVAAKKRIDSKPSIQPVKVGRTRALLIVGMASGTVLVKKMSAIVQLRVLRVVSGRLCPSSVGCSRGFVPGFT